MSTPRRFNQLRRKLREVLGFKSHWGKFFCASGNNNMEHEEDLLMEANKQTQRGEHNLALNLGGHNCVMFCTVHLFVGTFQHTQLTNELKQ